MNIPPQPVPTNVQVSQAQGPNGVAVVLTISDPTGLGVWFFPPANAKAIGEQLVKAGEAGNIVIAQPGAVPDLPRPSGGSIIHKNRSEQRAACREAERQEREARAQSVRESMRKSA